MKKLMIVSDIHGSAFWCGKVLEYFAEEKAERLFLLGDILYHGPRNDPPREYAPRLVAAMLNPLRERIFCVRGNCDAEVDQMMLEFPIMAGYAMLALGNSVVYAEHGHRLNAESQPAPGKGDILLFGHTHVPLCKEQNGLVLMNPGSVSLPKENSAHSYMLWDNGVFYWKELSTGKCYMHFGQEERTFETP